MTLPEFLMWVLGSGAMIFASFLNEKVDYLQSLAPEWKRYAMFGIAGVVAMIAYALTVVLGYAPVPLDAKMWIEALFDAVSGATGLAVVSELAHARFSLAKK